MGNGVVAFLFLATKVKGVLFCGVCGRDRRLTSSGSGVGELALLLVRSICPESIGPGVQGSRVLAG